MLSLTHPFKRPSPRHYALLDEQNRCRMLLSAVERPLGNRWMEVGEACLGMLGKPLPNNARPTS